MQFLDQIRRIERIDYLVRSRSTGKPVELARRIGISPSQLYLTIRVMKNELNAPIYYSKILQSYCYKGPVTFICAFKEE